MMIKKIEKQTLNLVILLIFSVMVYSMGFMSGLWFNEDVFVYKIRTNKKITPTIEMILINGQVSDTTYIYKEK